MKTYRIDLAYDGTRYKGWQRLGDDENTIQQKIEQALSRLLEETIEIQGSGRTDAGVHARQQVAAFSTKCSVAPEKLMGQLNHYLPGDIRVLMLSAAPKGFHPRHDVKSKVYRYQFWNAAVAHPLERRYRVHVPDQLDFNEMKKAALYFVGSHDFTAFTTAKSKKKSMVRTIESIDFVSEGPKMDIIFKGEGFLYNMVRILSGTLIEVGAGRMKAESMSEIIRTGVRSQAGPMAPAQGLILWDVCYETTPEELWGCWESI